MKIKFEKKLVTSLIAVGANLPLGGGSALQTCQAAVGALEGEEGLSVVAVSSWYESAPVPPSGQPPYVNGVVRVVTELEADALLSILQNIEQAFGRERSVRNAARTLDLDLIAWGDVCRTDPHLTLPHPRAHERAFVLLPLCDVMPEWVHPVRGVCVKNLLEAVSEQEISRIV